MGTTISTPNPGAPPVTPKDDHALISTWVQTQSPEGVEKNIQSDNSKVLTSEDLSIVWGSDPRYWKKVDEIVPNSSDKDKVSAYKLIEVCWLQIDGNCTVKLTKGKYGVYFIVKLAADIFKMNEVSLNYTRPDGKPFEKKEDLKKHQKDTWVWLKVGDFTVKSPSDDNKVKFSINGCEGGSWKSGLVIIGAAIMPLVLN